MEASQLVLTVSGKRVGSILKAVNGNVWSAVVSAYGPEILGPKFKRRQEAQVWLTDEIKRRQEAQRASGLPEYQVFVLRNGHRASVLLEILKVFEAHRALVGYPVSNEVDSALMSGAGRIAMDHLSIAIDPEMDALGLRGRSFLTNSEQALDEVIRLFPNDVKKAETVFLPLHGLSTGSAFSETIEDMVASLTDTLGASPKI
jgi:hypothetical protein